MAKDEQRNIALNFITNATQTKSEIDSLMSSLDNTSDEFKELQQQSASLDSAITDLSNAMNTTSGSSNILNTSMSKLEGEMNRANESIKRLNNTTKQQNSATDKQITSTKSLTKEVTENGGAMAILDTITGGWATTVKDGIEATALFTAGTNLSTIAQKAYTAVVGTSTGALKAFRIALAATGIGAAIVLIGFLVEAWMNLANATDEATEAQKRFDAQAKISKQVADERMSDLEFEAEMLREIARERGASIEEIRRLETEAYNKRLDELERQMNDERLSIEDRREASKKWSQEYNQNLLREQRWRADDAESARNTAKQTANNRTKISKDNSAELKRIEQERINFLKKIETDYNDWLKTNGSNVSDNNLAETEVNIRKLNELREQDLKDAQKYTANNKEKYDELTETINSYYDNQINKLTEQANVIKSIQATANNLQSTVVDTTNIESVSKHYQDILTFIEGIEDSDIKKFYSELFNVEDINRAVKDIEIYKEKVDELLDFNIPEGTTVLNKLFGSESDAQIEIDRIKTFNENLLNEQEQQALKEAELLNRTEAEKTQIKEYYTNLRIKNEQEAAEASNEINRLSQEQQLQALDSFGGALEATAGLLEEHTAGHKILAIAQTTIDTYTSAMSAYSGMVAAIPGPVGIAAGVAAAAASVVTGISNVKKILAVKVPGGGGGASATLPSATATPNVNFVSSSENQIATSVANATNNQNNEPIKAYVVSSDISTAQQLENNKIESNSI